MVSDGVAALATRGDGSSSSDIYYTVSSAASVASTARILAMVSLHSWCSSSNLLRTSIPQGSRALMVAISTAKIVMRYVINALQSRVRTDNYPDRW